MYAFTRKLLSPPPEGYFCMPLRISIILGLLALLYNVATPAQTFTCTSSQVCLDWTAPTQNVGGSLIAADQKPLAYRVYRKTATGVVRVTETQGTAIKLVNEPRGDQCWAVTAVDAKGAESSLSGFACKTVRFPGPTEGRVEKPTDGAIEPK